MQVAEERSAICWRIGGFIECAVQVQLSRFDVQALLQKIVAQVQRPIVQRLEGAAQLGTVGVTWDDGGRVDAGAAAIDGLSLARKRPELPGLRHAPAGRLLAALGAAVSSVAMGCQRLTESTQMRLRLPFGIRLCDTVPMSTTRC